MKSLRAFSLPCSTPWAITPEALQMILEIASREHLPDFEAVAAKRARRVDQADATARLGVLCVSSSWAGILLANSVSSA
jgi:hypothetical protein